MAGRYRRHMALRHVCPAARGPPTRLTTAVSPPLLLLQLFALLLLCASAACDGDDLQPMVRTDKGLLRGQRRLVLDDGLAVNEYLGIPYARPPVGRLRFRKPVPNGPWSGVYNATARPNACWQVEDTQLGDFVGSTMWNANTRRSEDCLYLNVWAPTSAASPASGGDEKYPVMVWIYGGGFYSGSSALDLYDGKYLAAAGRVVVVSMNYRLGLFGFLALRGDGGRGVAADGDERDDARGNMGLFDVILALRWVSANIDRFGGDPDSVTVFGESAGSVIVSLLLVSPLSADLFHRAVLQSGSALADWTLMSPENADVRYRHVFKPGKIDCEYHDHGGAGDDDVHADELLACLRSKDAGEIAHKAFFTADLMQFPFLPTVDHEFLVETPRAAIEGGRFKKCPLLIGSNANEGSYFLAYLKPFVADSFNRTEIDFDIGRALYREILERAFETYPQWPQPIGGLALDAIAYRYADWLRPDDTVSNRLAIDAAIGDCHFVCPVNRWADAYAERSPHAVYYYRYVHVSSRKPWGRWTGAMHADELHYVFGEPLRPDQPYTDDEKLFSEQMIAMWTNFARTGDPARPAPGEQRLWQWPRRTPAGQEYFELSPDALRSDAGVVGAGPRADYCAFWNSYLPGLMAATVNMEEAERDWKLQYNEWKSRYMVDWRDQYYAFVRGNERYCGKAANDNKSKPP